MRTKNLRNQQKKDNNDKVQCWNLDLHSLILH